MATIDVLIVTAYLCYSLSQGWRHRRVASRDLEQYFLAGRTLPGWKAGISMAATQFAADTPLVVTGLIATAGIFGLWRLWIYAIAFLLLGFLLGPSWRRAGVLTDAELSELRYGGKAAAWLRLLKAVYFGTVLNCIVLAMVLLAATRIAEPFLSWHEWLPTPLFHAVVALVERVGVPLTLVGPDQQAWPAEVWIRSANNLLSICAVVSVTVLYSATGGLRSVVDTDLLQFVVMMVGTLGYTLVLIQHVGGWKSLSLRLQELFAEGRAGVFSSPDQLLAFTPGADVPLAFLAVLGFQWLAQMNADGTGYLAQRTMACRSDRDAKQAAVWFTVVQILFRSWLWVPMGLALLVLYAPEPSPLSMTAFTAERERTYVRGIDELVPAGLKGLVLTGMLAALASTVDTHLNWGASYWSNDIYKRWICQRWLCREPSPRSLVWVARASNVAILCIAMLVMTQLGSIQEAWNRSLLLGAGMGGLLVLRWLWWRWNVYGELYGLLASALLLLALQLWVQDASWAFLLMFFGSTAAGVAASLMFPAEEARRLAEFYCRARPPGFWGPVARAVGCDDDGVRRLITGLLAVGLSAFSMFCLLTGLGSWLVGSPAPPWWPASRDGWVLSLCVFGIGLVPFWWFLAFSPRFAPPDARSPEATFPS